MVSFDVFQLELDTVCYPFNYQGITQLPGQLAPPSPHIGDEIKTANPTDRISPKVDPWGLKTAAFSLANIAAMGTPSPLESGDNNLDGLDIVVLHPGRGTNEFVLAGGGELDDPHWPQPRCY